MTTVLVAALGWGAASAEVLPACESPEAQAPGSVVLFHPGQPATLEKIDAIPPHQAANTLAVCYGPGCTPEAVRALSARRGWKVQATHDGTHVGIPPYQQQAPAPLAPTGLASIFEPQANTLSGPVAARQSAAPAGLAATAHSMPSRNLVATLAPETGGLLRRTLMLFFPLMVLGLGGTAVYIGYRQRPPAPPPPPTESEQLAQYVRQQHGRRRHSSTQS